MRHPATGGLAWLRSSVLVELDHGKGYAVTSSGQTYRLHRRISLAAVCSEGIEAWLAFDLLLGRDSLVKVPRPEGNRADDALWLTGCKMARHLCLDLPSRDVVEVKSFVVKHSGRYAALRSDWPRA